MTNLVMKTWLFINIKNPLLIHCCELFHSHEVYKGVDLMVYGTLIRNQGASFSLLISFLGVIENSYLFGCGKLYL